METKQVWQYSEELAPIVKAIKTLLPKGPSGAFLIPTRTARGIRTNARFIVNNLESGLYAVIHPHKVEALDALSGVMVLGRESFTRKGVIPRGIVEEGDAPYGPGERVLEHPRGVGYVLTEVLTGTASYTLDHEPLLAAAVKAVQGPLSAAAAALSKIDRKAKHAPLVKWEVLQAHHERGMAYFLRSNIAGVADVELSIVVAG